MNVESFLSTRAWNSISDLAGTVPDPLVSQFLGMAPSSLMPPGKCRIFGAAVLTENPDTMLEHIALGSDHAGYEYKERIAAFLREEGYEVQDYGVQSKDSADYPDYALKVAEAVANGTCKRGIIICGSGIGVSIVANKVAGIRAANCVTAEMAGLAREHNDANVLTIGERIVPWENVPEIIRTFMSTAASDNERHQRRVEKIHSLTKC